MITKEKFEAFTVYKSDPSSSFVYANFDNPELFMNGLADFILSETNLLNYANSLTPIEFEQTAFIYRKLYSALNIFLNDKLDLLHFDEKSQKVLDVMNEEYTFINLDGETLIQKDKIGKIGEYIFHLLLSRYYKIECIIPKFRCTTDRNMSVFGIDALFFDPNTSTIFFGESKVSKSIDNAITLVNRSFSDYEQQISEEYKLVLSNSDVFNLSPDFTAKFQEYTDTCISFRDFIVSASVQKICVPAFLAHGNDSKNDTPEAFLEQMSQKIHRQDYFGLQTDYIFISLPIINKDQIMDIIMKKVVEKSNGYEQALSKLRTTSAIS